MPLNTSHMKSALCKKPCNCSVSHRTEKQPRGKRQSAPATAWWSIQPFLSQPEHLGNVFSGLVLPSYHTPLNITLGCSLFLSKQSWAKQSCFLCQTQTLKKSFCDDSLWVKCWLFLLPFHKYKCINLWVSLHFKLWIFGNILHHLPLYLRCGLCLPKTVLLQRTFWPVHWIFRNRELATSFSLTSTVI